MRLGGLCLALAACGGGGGFPDAPVPEDVPSARGTFSVAWSLVDENNQPLSCERVAGQVVTVLAHNLAYMGGETHPFTCSTGMGESQGLVPGTYELDFELTSTFGLLARAPRQAPVEIRAGENTELAPLTFQVEAVGGLSLTLDTGKPGGNCGPTSSGGAGIEQVAITLTHNSDGTCEPITLSISEGTTQPGGNYTINCASPVDRPCIEEGQTITAMGVPSDAYTIRIRGKIGGTVCWSNMDSIQVPPLGQTLTRKLNLAHQSQTPGC